MKMRRAGNRSGESIVEVMASAVVFLLLMAVLQGAVMFSTSAQRKSRQIRQDTAKICEGFRSGEAEENGSEDYMFYASSADGTVLGNRVFSVSAPKQKKRVSYTGAEGEASEAVFYLYGADGGAPP